jgi:type I restriction enzyme S subunit
VTELPSGWVEARLSDVAEHVLGKMLDKQKNKGTPRPYLRNLNVQWGSFDLHDIKEMRITDQERERYLVRRGDVLVCEGGEPGRCAVWESDDEIYFQKALHRVRPSAELNPHFLAHFLRHAAINQLLDPLFTGSTIKHLPGLKLAQVMLPIPPRAQQDRIVAAIQTAMAGVDTAVSAVGEAEHLLDVHRASVLEAECLGRIGGERHAGPANGLPGIPQGWAWRPVAELAAGDDRAITDGPFGSNLKTAHYTDSGPRVIRLQNVGEGEFLDFEAHISQEHFERLRAHEARPGDVVVASLGETLPRACVVPEDLGPAIVKADCPRIRVGELMRSEFLCAALNSPPVRRQAAGLIAGIGRPRLNLAKLKQLRIPTPPLVEQDRILQRIHAHAAAREQVAEALSGSRMAAGNLHRSILNRALTGHLIPQVPEDEFASELVPRIRDDRGAGDPQLKAAAS